MKKFLSLFVCVALIITASLVVVGCGGDQDKDPKATVTVKSGESLVEAIAAAEAGAVILVKAGTYDVTVSITKDVTLLGEGTTTILNGNISLNNANLTIRKLNMVGAAEKPGTAIDVQKETQAKAVKIEYCTIKDYATGLYFQIDSLGTVNANKSTFDNLTCGIGGIEYITTLTLTGNTFKDSDEAVGGCKTVAIDIDALFNNNTFTNNVSDVHHYMTHQANGNLNNVTVYGTGTFVMKGSDFGAKGAGAGAKVGIAMPYATLEAAQAAFPDATALAGTNV